MPPQPPPVPSHFLFRTVLVAVAALLALGIGGYFFWKHSFHTAIAPSVGTSTPAVSSVQFSFHDGVVSWYELDGSEVNWLSGPTRSPAEQAVVLAVARPGITLQNIAEGPGGNVAYSYSDAGAIASAAKSGKAIIADAPNNPGWPYELSMIDSSSASSTPKFTSAGYGPAFTQGGVLLALAPEGVSSYNTLTGARQLLIPMQNVNVAEFALSPKGSYAVIPNAATKSFDVFSMNPSTFGSSYLGSIPIGSATAAAFVSVNRFIVRTAPGSGTLYTITSQSVDKGDGVVLPTL